jgi:Single-strand binding protein family
LSVATQRSWKNADDEWASKTEWHRVVLFWPRLADFVARTIKKGAHVLVEGTLVSSTYEQPNGKGKKSNSAKITTWSIRADVVRKLDDQTEDELSIASQLSSKISTWFGGLTADQRTKLGLLPVESLKRPHFHASRRVTSDGTLRFGLVVQLVQTQFVNVSGVVRQFPTGLTLVIDVTGQVRFVIGRGFSSVNPNWRIRLEWHSPPL